MLGFPNPAILSAGAGGRTYDDWVAHVTDRSGSNLAYWNNQNNAPSVFRVRADSSTLTGSMFGSPFLGGPNTGFYGFAGTTTCRLIQHCLPSEDAFEQQRANSGWMILVQGSSSFRMLAQGTARNGFTSVTQYYDPDGADCRTVATLGWWDFSTQTALMNSPMAGTGPVPYTAPGW